jgi:CTP synthase (UTP-ammonia lyase)
MNNSVTIGIVGDAVESHIAHQVTDNALKHTAKYLSKEIDFSWIPTKSLLTSEGRRGLEKFDGIFGAPGGAYDSPDGALVGIQFAREQNRPFIGTWGGYQHALLEYARNVAGIKDAGHTIYGPTPVPVLIPILHPVPNRSEGDASMSGMQKVKILPETMAFRIYQKSDIEEEFHCNYELNPAYREKLEAAGLIINAVGMYGEAMGLELANHPFFFASGFMPQFLSEEGKPHPIFVAYLEAILNIAWKGLNSLRLGTFLKK